MRFIILLCSLFVFTPVYSADEEESAAPEVVYHKLDPQFTVNLQGNKHYLRATIQLQLKNKEVKDAIETHDAAIRHSLLLLLSDNDAKDIGTIQGREKLRLAAIDELNKTLKQYAKKTGVVNVLFTEFMSQ